MSKMNIEIAPTEVFELQVLLGIAGMLNWAFRQDVNPRLRNRARL